MLKSTKNHKILSKPDLELICMGQCDEDLDVVKRITVTLDDETHLALQQWADEEARSVPNLLAWLAMKAVKEKQQDKK